jgi:ADP-ribosylglycohydrolase
MPLSPRERIIGGLLGLVVGDALGVPVEFSSRLSRDRDPVSGMRGFGTHNQPPGTWSDDGAMALASAAAFVAHGADEVAQLRAFLGWLDEAQWTAHGRVFDVGNTTRNSLMRVRLDFPVEETGGTDERDNGNGSLMRILPASCWWFGAGTLAVVEQAGRSSAHTHAHIRSRLCCALHALLCEALIEGAAIEAALSTASQRLRRHVPPEERAFLARLLDSTCLTLPRERVPSDGYVVSTLEASCWCLQQHRDFSGAVLAAVNLGGDTDTTAAVTGGLAGLRCGLAGIPEAWIATLPRRAAVIALAERFADACLEQWSRCAADEGTRNDD